MNRTDITIILDRSGSMEATKTETIRGYNSLLETQKALQNVDVRVSLVEFHSTVHSIYTEQAVINAGYLTTENYRPAGNTALLDAIGTAIDSTGQRLALKAERDRPEKVLFVIVTDGEENWSSKYTQGQIGSMVRHQREKYNWDFLFIGANQDAVLTARKFEIPLNKSFSYTNQGAHALGSTQAAFQGAAAYTATASASNSMDAFLSNSVRSSDRNRQASFGVVDSATTEENEAKTSTTT